KQLMTFVQAPASGRSTWLKRALWGPRELRAGWRFALFVGLFEIGILIGNAAVKATLGELDAISDALARKLVNIVVVLAASATMGKLEGRTIADYGLPWRRLFGARFWQGFVLSVAALAALLGAMAFLGVFRIDGLALGGAKALGWGALFFL